MDFYNSDPRDFGNFDRGMEFKKDQKEFGSDERPKHLQRKL